MNFKNMGSEPVPATPLPLARQLSVYSLTFDEFQSTLGGPQKDFGSMNMDEFLRNIWTAEESQAMASALGCGGGGQSSGAEAAAAAAAAMGGPSVASNNLQRQGSLTLPRTLSQKTVDEVWKELLRESNTDGSELQQHQRQQTLGEMTLEEFLVRAGVVREEPIQRPIISSNNNNNNNNHHHHVTANNGNCSSIFFGELPNSNNSNPGLSLGFAQNSNRNQANLAKRPYPAPLQVGGNVVGIGDNGMNNGLIPGGVVGLGGGGGGVMVAGVASPDGLGKGNGDLSSLSPVPYMFGSGMRGRKCSGAVEKVVERRQRRMIKNRESAARSRARKQAYTMELEAEVAKLKEQNQELEKKQAEIMEMQKNQVMELINQQRGPKKLCLRRTQTGPW